MKTTENVRKYAALKRGIEEKSQEFGEKGAEVYAKEWIW